MFFGLKFVWVHHLCGFCAGVAVSFTFDCFSILARVLEMIFSFNRLFSDKYIFNMA